MQWGYVILVWIGLLIQTVSKGNIDISSERRRALVARELTESKESTGKGSIEREEEQPPKFTLALAVQGVDESFEKTIIYEDGRLRNKFENCTPSEDADKGVEGVEPCFVEDIYIDRISFQYSFDKNVSFAAKEPVVEVRGGTAHPGVTDFMHEDSSGSFTVLYKCDPGDDVLSLVTMTVAITGDSSMKMEWGKRCGSGAFPHIAFGYLNEDRFVNFAMDTEGKQIAPLEVGPIAQSTQILMRLKSPVETLEFLTPYVSSDSTQVGVTMRGTIAGGTLSSEDSTEVTVLYECQESDVASASITFTVAIPPWSNLTAHWKKNCDGGRRQGLLIGTTGAGSHEIIKEAQLNPVYDVTDATTVDQALSNHVNRIPSDQNRVTFYVTNADVFSNIYIDKIAITISHPQVLAARIEAPTIGSLVGSGFIDGQGTSLAKGETKQLRLHLPCRQKGSSLVIVTIPTLIYKNAEFGFIKECEAPAAHRHVEFLTTAGFMWDAIMIVTFFGICALGLHFFRKRTSPTPKYEPLATGSNGV